jgi:hypothetical protein
MLKGRIGSIIKGHLSEKCLYTENYVQIQKVKLAGSLEATLKPIRLSILVKELDLDVSMSLGKQFHAFILNKRDDLIVYSNRFTRGTH